MKSIILTHHMDSLVFVLYMLVCTPLNTIIQIQVEMCKQGDLVSYTHLTANIPLSYNVLILEEEYRLDGECQELGEAYLSVLKQGHLRYTQ